VSERPDSPGDDVDPLTVTPSAVLGSKADGEAGQVRVRVGSDGVDAELAVVLRNRLPPHAPGRLGGSADRPLQRLGVLGADGRRRRTSPGRRDRLARDPGHAPFEWAPGDADVISVAGTVASWGDELAAVDGFGGPVQVQFSLGDAGYVVNSEHGTLDAAAG
jgi:hypothetical protein